MLNKGSSTYWVFTLNNVCTPPWKSLPKGVKYLVCQHEKGASGTDHLQGYIQLQRDRPLVWLKKNINKEAHWEQQRAKDSDQARDYCMKSDTRVAGPWQFGKYVRKQSGKRNDIAAFRDAIREGNKLTELWDNFPTQMARYPKMYSDLHALRKGRKPPQVELLYGPTGTGKTKWFYDNAPEGNWYCTPVSNGTLWLDGYRGQSWVLFDDFSGQMRLTELLRLLDRYPVSVPVKGGFADFSPAERIVITTNIHPYKWYKTWEGREGQYNALCRRFRVITEFEGVGGARKTTNWEPMGEDMVLTDFFIRGVPGFGLPRDTRGDGGGNAVAGSTYDAERGGL